MLSLTRKEGESVVIGGSITVRVVSVRNGEVRLGIDAPRSIPVHREEIAKRIAEQTREAAQRPPRGLLPDR